MVNDYQKMYYEALSAAGIHESHTHDFVLAYLKQQNKERYQMRDVRRLVRQLNDHVEAV